MTLYDELVARGLIAQVTDEEEIKELIKTLKQVNPFVESNIFRSVENVNLSTVVAYKKDGVKHHFLDTYDDVVQTENEPGMQSGAEIQMQSEETR